MSTSDPAKKAATPRKRPGPPSRAQIEAELRAKIAEEVRAEVTQEVMGQVKGLVAEMRSEVEAQVREELAAARAKEDEAARNPVLPKYDLGVDLDAEDALTIHFIVDGVSAWGKVWYRGEEVTIKRGSPEWQAETNRLGEMVYALNEAEQLDRFGVVRWRPGPWRGKPYDLNDADVMADDPEKARARLMTIQRERDARKR